MIGRMSNVVDKPLKLFPGRFAYLMGLYAENHARLVRLFAPQRLEPGTYLSSIDDGLDVRLDLIEQHRYTVELRLNYVLRHSPDSELAPSARPSGSVDGIAEAARPGGGSLAPRWAPSS